MSAPQQLLELLHKKLQEREESVSAALRDGAAKDYAEYKEICGVVRGLGLAQMEITDLLRKIKEHEDDD